jgi:hypothetical protein
MSTGALPLLVLAMTLHLSAAPMTDEDREHLLVHFEMTGQMLAEQVRGSRLRNWSSRPPPIAGAFGNAFHIWRLRNPIIGVI